MVMGIDTDGFEIRKTFITKLLRGFSVTPLSGVEVKLIANQEALTRIDEHLGGAGLLGLINALEGLVSLRDVVFLFLDAYDDDMLDTAVEIFDSVKEDRVALPTAELVKVYQECNDDIPPSLMVGLMGSESEAQSSFDNDFKNTMKKSSLNLDAMRDFK